MSSDLRERLLAEATARPLPARRLSRSSSRHATRPTMRPRLRGWGRSQFLALRQRREASNGAACKAR